MMLQPVLHDKATGLLVHGPRQSHGARCSCAANMMTNVRRAMRAGAAAAGAVWGGPQHSPGLAHRRQGPGRLKLQPAGAPAAALPLWQGLHVSKIPEHGPCMTSQHCLLACLGKREPQCWAVVGGIGSWQDAVRLSGMC